MEHVDIDKKKKKSVKLKNGKYRKKDKYLKNTNKKNNALKNDRKKITSEEQQKNKRKYIIKIIIVIILFFLFLINLKDFLIGMPSKPVLSQSDGWGNSKVVKVEKDSTSRKELKYYLYCIIDKDDVGSCKWKKTTTKNITVSTSGKYYVYFKGVNVNGLVGEPSSPSIVLIDNEAPNILGVKTKETTNSIKVKINAEDNESGIDKYFFKLEDGKYIESEKDTYIFKELTPDTLYKITVKVRDKSGNEKVLSFDDRTLKESVNDSEDEKNSSTSNNKENKKNSENSEESSDSIDPSDPIVSPTIETEEIPQISLSKVPTSFILGDSYDLPSSYKFGKSGGVVKCVSNEIEYTNTVTLPIGKNKIVCTATSNKGVIVKTSKTVNVGAKESKTVIFDGWITMTLFYPEDSTNWQWRLGKESDIRTGEDDTSWMDYVGPITVKLSDVENIYIKYTLPSKKTVVVAPSNRLLVDIVPDNFKIKNDTETNVSISYSDDADKKQYKIDDGEWMNYNGKFAVMNNTKIEARVIKNVKTYDDEGELISTVKKTSYDSVYIGTLSEDDPDPNPSHDSKIAGPIIKITPRSEWTSKVTVNLTTKEKAKKIYYKIGEYGSWKEYTKDFEVSKNKRIYAKYVVNSTNKTSLISSKYITNIMAEEANKPSVSISANPESLVDSVLISLKAKNYDLLEYSLDGINYSTYTGSFSVTSICTVYARATNSNGTTIEKRYIKNLKEKIPPLPYLIDGPIISSTPATLNSYVDVEITTKEAARKIYYKIGESGTWKSYTDTLRITSNTEIFSKYITAEDGITSSVTSKYIDNIQIDGKPNVAINITPKTKFSSVTATIYGNDYNKLQYSYDNVIYYDYVNPLTITKNCTIYAKGTNDAGTTTVKQIVSNIAGSVPINDKLSVAIFANPDEDGVEGLINKTDIEIHYDSKATEKYYKIGDGEWQEYTGTFTLTSNSVVRAYAKSATGSGNASKSISYLTTGMASPLITTDTDEAVSNVSVTIKYDKNAIVKKYSIDDGDILDYNGSFTVDDNCTIYAYSENSLGYTSDATYVINNVTKPAPYILDYGKYYIMKLNYPSTSIVSSREYKWTKDGTWTKYPSAGIMLIKKEFEEEMLASKTLTGIRIEDENGNTSVFTGDYYIVNMTSDELEDNIFMRWDITPPTAPKIAFNTTSPTKKLGVTIDYDGKSAVKQYKLVYPDGKETEWLDYKGTFYIRNNKTIIYARGISSYDQIGKESFKKVTNIDEVIPDVTINGDLTTPKRKVALQLIGKDDIKIARMAYTKGDKGVEYFNDDNGITVKNKGKFTVTENGIYTIYIVDGVGNSQIKKVNVENIDLNAPDISIDVLTEDYGTEAEITIDYGDSTNKQYKVGTKGTYKTYSGAFVIKSNDVLNLANDDGTITIYAKGKDKAGNVNEINEIVNILDLDAPSTPIITSYSDYPIITENGVKYNNYTSINFDNRDDIVNYYSTDGTNWEYYTGPIDVAGKTIYAKSVKKESGLTISSNKKIEFPNNALGIAAYDKSDSTYYNMPESSTKYINVSPEMIGKKIRLKFAWHVTGNAGKIRFFDESGNVLTTYTYSGDVSKTLILDVPENTFKLGITYGGSIWYTRVYEVRPYDEPTINVEKIYPKLTEYEVEKGYSVATIDYYSTAVRKLYSIDDGVTWKNYVGPVNLPIGTVIQAKSVDIYGVSSTVVSYTSVLPSDALTDNAYDGDESTRMTLPYRTTKYAAISEEMRGKKLSLKFGWLVQNNAGRIKFYDSDGNVLSTYSYSGTVSKTVVLDIPENAVKIGITYGATVDLWYCYVYEIRAYDEPTINYEKIYPTLTSSGVKDGYSKVSIDYFQTAIKKLYSIDDGVTWNNYTKGMDIPIGTTILAKSINKYGNDSTVVSYESVLPTDTMGVKAYDGDISTYYGLPSSSTKSIGIDQRLIGQKLSIKFGWHVSGNKGRIRFYDKEGNQLSVYSYSGEVTKTVTLDIPEGAYKFSVTYGAGIWHTRVYEIKAILSDDYSEADVDNDVNISDGSDQKLGFVDAPIISSSDSDKYTATKDITVYYPSSEFVNQYSFDAKTWYDYNDVITVDKACTIYTRSLDGEKVVSSSSYKITKIDDTVPSVGISDVPLEITVGDDYSLPSTVSYDETKSGGNVVCYANGIEVTSTKDLTAGTYTIKCTVTTGVGKISNVEKNIVINNKTEIVDSATESSDSESTDSSNEGGINNEETPSQDPASTKEEQVTTTDQETTE